MSLVPGYGSGSDDDGGEEEEEDPWANDAVNTAAGKASVAGNRAAVPDSDSDDSDDGDSDDEGDGGGDALEEPAPSLLPKPDDAFAFVDGPPAFLTPEATKQMNIAPGAALGRYRRPGDGDESEEEEEVGHREAAPQSAVLESKAVRYDPGEPQGELAAHMAAHGAGGSGKVDLNRDDRKRKPTKAMEVDDFMAKGGALPRKRADQKEREEKKRKLGQSSHSEWKTEAEMVLRQQYD